MGGGVSSAASEQMEEMMAYSVLLGRTITCMSFPGMHSIKDFNLLPPREKSVTINQSHNQREGKASGENISTKASEDPPPLIGPKLEDKFTVAVDGEVIVLDDVTKQNDDGWTPLHACCHSNTTATTGLMILKEMVALGGDLNLKTTTGPGRFNSGYTPLHMASAYGVAALVEELLKAGADPNCRNSFDWSPLLEVCHRGFAGVTTSLVRGGADVSHIPNADASCGAHIMRGAPQSPLGEAARGGFKAICKFLLDAGSNKDQQNHLGWTPLHEACYYNHLDTAQLLLVHGADATTKNVQGAMPFNMTSFQPIRDVLREIGGEEAAKAMPTPTFSVCVNENGQMFVHITAGNKEEEKKDGEGGKEGREEKSEAGEGSTNGPSTSPRESASPSRYRGPHGRGGGGEQEGLEEGGEVLHRGEMLGELPALGRPSVQSASEGSTTIGDGKRDSNDRSLHRARQRRKGSSGGDGEGSEEHRSDKVISLRMPGETDERRAPEGIICQLSKRVARDPVRTPYGHLFDRQMIQLWLSKQGSICPLSGQPLVEAELTPDEKVQEEVKAWQKELLQKKTSSLGKNSTGKSKAKPTVGGREGGKHQQELTGSSSNSPSLRTRPIDEAAKLSLEGRSDTEAISGVEDDKGCPESVRRDSGGNGRECKGTVDEDDLYDF